MINQAPSPKEWYDQNYESHERFRNKIESLIKEAIDETNIRIHAISSRVKDKDSFLEKFNTGEYDSVDEITDVVGVRNYSKHKKRYNAHAEIN
ncbi:MAG: hypothetical protein FWC16_05030 [Defluviitaleaceae bacterium]|nr:hypothetical protein [Defluviitaleaceae bacterium]MCL2274271.1 hypothetical protein [Defluviitaleaceae bacterium]